MNTTPMNRTSLQPEKLAVKPGMHPTMRSYLAKSFCPAKKQTNDRNNDGHPNVALEVREERVCFIR